jgi:diguanylate cyclase (GGDEF)-like protein
MRAVVVDADPVARVLLHEALGRTGHAFETFADGEEALARFAREPLPALAILDWRADGVDGVDLARRLRSLGPRAPYVLLTAAPGEREAARTALTVGADDLIEKPLRLDELELRLRIGMRTQAARMEVLRLRAELIGRSRVDLLTGLADRRAITERLQDELARGKRMAAPIGLLLIDVDQFRAFNDVFGHEAGDAVLTTIAARLRRVLRRYDSFGRWGVEEFLAVLPGCKIDQLGALSERLLAAIRSDSVVTSQGRVAVTCSIGAFGLPCDAPEDIPDVDVIAAVLERAANEAARAGGDRVRLLKMDARSDTPDDAVDATDGPDAP